LRTIGLKSDFQRIGESESPATAGNARVVAYLAQWQPEILAEFQKTERIAEGSLIGTKPKRCEMGLAEHTLAAIRSLGAEDYIDLQSFIYVAVVTGNRIVPFRRTKAQPSGARL
jgi:hypothetical protein